MAADGVEIRTLGDDPHDGDQPDGAAAGAGLSRSPGVRLLLWAALVVVGVVVVRMFLVQSFVIPSGSMERTLDVGDRVLVSRVDYRFGHVRRGDIVVFDGAGVFDPVRPSPGGLAALGRATAKAVGMPTGEVDYVKRVVGLPGDHVVCCDRQGRITVGGRPLHEPYLYPGDTPSELTFDVTVPPGRLFVLGDHRSDSGDSRYHLGDPGGGTVPEDQVIGRVVARWWPLDRIGGLGRVDLFAAAAPLVRSAATAQDGPRAEKSR